MRERLCLTLPSDLLAKLNDLADRRKLSRSAVAEAAIASFLSPDAQDMREAAFTAGSTACRARRRGWNATCVSPPIRWRCSSATG